MIKRSTQFIGLLGLNFLLFCALLQRLIENDEFNLIPLHGALGVICLFYFILRGGTSFLRSSSLRRSAGLGIGLTVYSLIFVGVLISVNYAALLKIRCFSMAS